MLEPDTYRGPGNFVALEFQYHRSWDLSPLTLCSSICREGRIRCDRGSELDDIMVVSIAGLSRWSREVVISEASFVVQVLVRL